MKNDELMLKLENVSKIYRLGEIGGTTLRDELQRFKAKLLKKEDPTKKIGSKNYNKGEKFKALDGISFEVKKGERIGIIGHNGAGKSTLLKLISRVTGPTDGQIYLNGRVASMLEVGTGFHPELTGRENVYMNGAILGMTKKEIDAKMEDIIEFSEVRQFIDTPVKRYSSGMYVKLAFSVAAHLNSEIMIMDEVLAVGDVQFQNKCLRKMKSVSEEENRTILYVSHNMSTIRQLCDRVVVLNHGKVVYDGDVEKGISTYLSKSDIVYQTVDLLKFKKNVYTCIDGFQFKTLRLVNKNEARYLNEEYMKFKIDYDSSNSVQDIFFRVVVFYADKTVVGMTHTSDSIFLNKSGSLFFALNIGLLSPGFYSLRIYAYGTKKTGESGYFDVVNEEAINFEICSEEKQKKDEVWNHARWGHIHFDDLVVNTDDIFSH